MPVLSTTYLHDAVHDLLGKATPLAHDVADRLARTPRPVLALAAAAALVSLPVAHAVTSFLVRVARAKSTARRKLYIVSRDGKTRRAVPGLADAGFAERYLTGHMPAILAALSIVAYQERQLGKLGPIHSLRDLGGSPGVVVADPRALYYLCTTRAYATVKPPELADPLAFVTGRQGLLVLEGDAHKAHRKIVNPVFNLKTMKQLLPVMDAAFDELEALLDAAVASGTPVEFQDLATGVTLNVIGRAALATDFDALRPGQPSPLTTAYAVVMRVFEINAWNFFRDAFPLLNKLPVPRNRELRAARKLVATSVDAILRTTQADLAAGRDVNGGVPSLVATLMDAVAQGGDGGKLTMRELRDELLTFLAAGHETSANLFGMLVYYLAKHPDVQAKLAAEVDAPGVDSTYLGDVVNEALRLHSPAYATTRLATEDLQVPLSSGETLSLPAGLVIYYPIQAIHTDPQLWGPDAHAFRPERWSDEVHHATTPTEPLPAGKTRLIPPYGFMPFLGGARACIGRAFAIMELKQFTARLVARYAIRLADDEYVPRVEFTVTAKAVEIPLVFAVRK
ncbi:hypothetical protein H9P43_006592 [Blastocladiella emersonii ATCC 22665]|nr:hypothetical protein H9P43_006592 [Blastocladiella emersonii ATCC 22665]